MLESNSFRTGNNQRQFNTSVIIGWTFQLQEISRVIVTGLFVGTARRRYHG
jgi:hypothetical protein